MYRVRGMVSPFGYTFEHFMIDPITYWRRFFAPRVFITFNIANITNDDNDQREKETEAKVITRDDLEHLIISSLQSLKDTDPQSYDHFFDWLLQSLKDNDPQSYDQFFDWLKKVLMTKS